MRWHLGLIVTVGLLGASESHAPVPPMGVEAIRSLLEQAERTRDQDAQRALEQAEEGLRLAERQGAWGLRAEAWTLKARILERLSKLTEAVAALREAEGLAARAQSPYVKAKVALGWAHVHERLGDYDVALEWAYHALEGSEAAPNPALKAECLSALGLLHARLSELAEAETRWREALAIQEALKNRLGMAKTLNNLGVMAKQNGRLDEALSNYDRAEAIHAELGQWGPLSDVLNNKAVIAFLKKDFPTCEALHRQALNLRERLGDPNAIATSCYNLADLYLAWGKLDSGSGFLQRALSLAGTSGSLPLQIEVWKLASTYAEKRGRLAEALAALRTSTDASNRWITEENLRKAKVLKIRFDVERSQRQLELLRNEREARRIQMRLLIGGLLAMAGLCVALVLRYRLRVRSQRHIEAQKRELETLDRIVQEINAEMDYQGLLQAILRRTLDLVPQVDKAGLLRLHEEEGVFRYAATHGATPEEREGLVHVRLAPEEALERYGSPSRSVAEGICLTTDFSRLPGNVLDGFPIPAAMLSLALTLEGKIVAFLVMDSSRGPEAFGPDVIARLQRLRHHAISAVAKLRLLERMDHERQRAESALEKLRTAYRRLGETQTTTDPDEAPMDPKTP